MTKRVADALDDAADIIEKNGWVQKAKRTKDGYCTIGAIEMAIYFQIGRGHHRFFQDDERFSLYLSCCDAVFSEVPFEFHSIAAWNDCEIRVRQEVLDTLRLAAKRERLT